jgi:hypothetical protein
MYSCVQAARRINEWYHQEQIAGNVDLTEEIVRRAADTGAVVLPVTETRVGNIKFMFVDSNGDEVPVRCETFFPGNCNDSVAELVFMFIDVNHFSAGNRWRKW